MSQFQIKKSLEFDVCGYQKSRVPACQLCGYHAPLQMHHIINRSFIPHNKIDELPLVFHALLCDNCHLKNPDLNKPDTRAALITQNALIFGWELVEEGFLRLEDILPNGLDSNI